MPFRYLIRWKKVNPEEVSVEAYHKYPHSEEERRKPAFVIGRGKGSKLLLIRHLLEQAAKKNSTRRYGKSLHIRFNEDQESYDTVFRIGLAVALIGRANGDNVDCALRYVLSAPPEEVWFWTSKLLNDETGPRAIGALMVISGAAQTGAATGSEPKPKAPKVMCAASPNLGLYLDGGVQSIAH
ncbi:MAG: hypothetical protein H5T32_06970 [Candidatus Methanosuratus sp.]|nr:hypothetical protein [Candidatus Methanosuratincola sp.]